MMDLRFIFLILATLAYKAKFASPYTMGNKN